MTSVIKPPEVRFHTPLWWAVLMIPTFVTPILAVLWLALGLLVGRGAPLGWPLVYSLAGATAGGILGSVLGRRRHPSVSVSEAGIEVSRPGAAIFINWPDVASIAVHRHGPFAVLDVVPTALHHVIQTGFGTPTPVHQIGARQGFRVGVGELLPGPRTLRRVLSQYSQRVA